MRRYNGAREERPQGGGRYNREHIGSELFNFKPVKEYLYGFVNAGSGGTAVNLRRLDPAATGKAELDNVTVVFVARHPQEGGQRVVGWYKDATVYAKKRRHPLRVDYKKKIDSCVRAPASKACLVPTPARKQDVPLAKGRAGGMGQSNVRYFDEHDGRKRWMERVLEYVENYAGPNLLEDEDAEAEQSEAAEIVIETSAGFETNPKIRRAVEEHAMKSAERHFTKLGFSVKRVGKPYDLLCRKQGVTKFVEVKGTRTTGAAVALTRNEVDFLQKNAPSAVLFVVHSVRLKNGKKPTAYGGEQKLVEPWDSACGVLKPITFFLHFR
jgi:hypothetical protein